jgi:hypothetical protein
MTAAPFRSRRRLAVVASAALAFLAACGDNPAAPIEGAGDPENISRVTITLAPVGTGTTVTSVVVDPDGTTLPQNPRAPQGTLALVKGKTYNGSIALLNDLDPNNVIDITGEVRKESDFHRFFYTLSCAGVTVPTSSLDLDSQTPGQPVGINFQVVVDANAASTTTCTLHVELHHFEAAKGDGLGSTFDTDLTLDFPVTVS